ncbi:PilZ domain-containing protein [Wenxinia saemankumensis]|nr:PilZ domain-containing protein [Wenxinia saemankumensis]
MWRLVLLLCLSPAGLAAQDVARPGGVRGVPGGLDLYGQILGVGLVLALIAGAIAIWGDRFRRSRRERRFDCDLPVRLVPDRGDPAVRLVDLSRHGARLRMSAPPAQGTRIGFLVCGVRITGTVAWTGEVFVGLRLHRALPKAVLMRLLAESAARAAPAERDEPLWARDGRRG